MIVTFNRRPPILGPTIEQPPQELVKNTPSLWQADLDTAVRYGGELTHAALGAMNLRGDKRFTVVDTKVHMLMPGQCPAIPGWHTDGAPRLLASPQDLTGHLAHSPTGQGPPDLRVQEHWGEEGRTPRFHLLVTGHGCLTEFLWNPLTIDIAEVASPDLYAELTTVVEQKRGLDYVAGEDLATSFRFAPSCTVIEWDWWNLHQGILAQQREWRFLIRVTESDYHEPLPPSRLPEIIRTQQMVYTPMRFGW